MTHNVMLSVPLMELMISKICHDLISPVGAVCNGIEILEEMGAQADEEVTNLIAFSARQASARLQAFRMAYGAGGMDSGIRLEKVHDVFEATLVADKKYTQNWLSDYTMTPDDLPPGFCKMLLACLLLGTESMPKGGALSIEVHGIHEVSITCRGEKAAFSSEELGALNLRSDPGELGPKTVHFYVTGLLAQQHGYTISVDDKGDNSLQILLGKAIG